MQRPMVAVWELTTHCQGRCKHCYVAHKHQSLESKELSSGEALAVADWLHASNAAAVHLLGGEPLLRVDLLQIIHALVERGISVSLNTNGISVNVETAQALARSGIARVDVSLDGASSQVNDSIRGKGSYRQAVHAIRQLVTAAQKIRPMEIGICFTTTLANIAELPAMPSIARHLGCDVLKVIRAHVSGRLRDHAKELTCSEIKYCNALDGLAANNPDHRTRFEVDGKPLLKTHFYRKYGVRWPVSDTELKCSGGEDWVVIEPDGSLRPCHALFDRIPASYRVLVRNNPPNLLRCESMAAFRHHSYNAAFREIVAQRQLQYQETSCADCQWKTVCSPCPLSHRGSEMPRQCSWARRKDDELTKQMMGSCVEILPVPAKMPLQTEQDSLIVGLLAKGTEPSQILSVLKKFLPRATEAEIARGIADAMLEAERQGKLRILRSLHRRVRSPVG